MEEDSDSISFKVVFDNQVLLLTYDKTFEDFKNLTIESLIQDVLDNIGPKPQTKQPKDFILHCPCGRILEHNLSLSGQITEHSCLEDTSKGKSKNETYLLIEKEEIKEEGDEELSKEEFEEILNKVLNKKKKAKPKNSNENINEHKKSENSQMPMFAISENLKNKIKEYIVKEERGNKIRERGYNIYYNEEYYNNLLDMGINKNKAKAGLRLVNNNNGEAAILCTDDRFNWENVEFLYFDNEEVLTKEKLDELCIKEIKKEYPFIKDNEEIRRRFNHIMNILGYKKVSETNNKVIKNPNGNHNSHSDGENDDEEEEEV